MREEVKEIVEALGHQKPTCSIHDPKAGAVTFWRDRVGCPQLPVSLALAVIVGDQHCKILWPDWIKSIVVKDPEWSFWCYHNWYWSSRELQPGASIGKDCLVHPTAQIGSDAMKFVAGPGRERLRVEHIGRAVLGDRVEVGPNSVVHKAVLTETRIEDDVVIGSLNNIGHNVTVGRRTFITVGVLLSGSCSIGADCFIGTGVTVTEGVRICDKVKIGAGSVVTRDITKSGVWFGSPVKFRGDWDGRW